MRNKRFVLYLFFIITLNLVTVSHGYSYSVDVGDTLTYTIEDQGDEGEVNVVVEEIISSDVDPIQHPDNMINIIGTVTGEYHDDITTMEMKYGWRALLYMNTNMTISINESAYSLHSMIYESKYPFIWPTNEEFYEHLEFEGSHYSESLIVEHQNGIWTITEIIDDTPVDGCLCETVVTVENGIMTSFFSNQTVYFTLNGPQVHISTVSLTEFESNSGLDLPFFEFLAVFSFLPIIFARKLLK